MCLGAQLFRNNCDVREDINYDSHNSILKMYKSREIRTLHNRRLNNILMYTRLEK